LDYYPNTKDVTASNVNKMKQLNINTLAQGTESSGTYHYTDYGNREYTALAEFSVNNMSGIDKSNNVNNIVFLTDVTPYVSRYLIRSMWP